MRAHPSPSVFLTLRAALVAVLLAVAPAANSQMYRWTDANGTVMFSDKPPAGGAVAHDLTVVLDNPGTMTDRRSGAATAVDQPKASGASASSSAAAEAAAPPPPRVTGISPNAPEAVRDPCLRSADPKCYERNRNAYVPYLGYSPHAARDAAVGASSSAAAGGTLAGDSPPPAPGKITPPKASVYALPPGSERR